MKGGGRAEDRRIIVLANFKWTSSSYTHEMDGFLCDAVHTTSSKHKRHHQRKKISILNFNFVEVHNAKSEWVGWAAADQQNGEDIYGHLEKLSGTETKMNR